MQTNKYVDRFQPNNLR